MNNIITTLATALPNQVDGGSDIQGAITKILQGVIAVLGIACVVVMIIGGVNYMTSAGDTGKVEKGKKTILYGMIGLVICVLAFMIVNWTIGAIGNSTCEEGKHYDETTKACVNNT